MFETQPCGVCHETDFAEDTSSGALICNVCGNIEYANQILELDVDDALAINSRNKAAIVRISAYQTVAVGVAKTKPDMRTPAQFLGLLVKIGNSIAAELKVSDHFEPLLTKYLEVLESRKFFVGQISDADNMFMFDRKSKEISDQQLSFKELRRRLELSGFPGHLTHRMRKSEIVDLLKISDHNVFLPPQPSFLVILALLEISSQEISFPGAFERVPIFSLVPGCEEISDFFVEATHGKYRSFLRLEKFPTRAQLDEVKFALHAGGVVAKTELKREPLAMIDQFGGGREARRFFYFLEKNKINLKKYHRSKFRELVHSLTGNFILKHSVVSVHRKSFSLRDAPVIGNFFWSLDKISAVVVAAEALKTKKFPTIPNLEISVHEYLSTPAEHRNRMVEFCRSEVFHHANPSVFSDLVNLLDISDEISDQSGQKPPADDSTPVPLVFWHPKKPQPGNFPEKWRRLLRYLHIQSGISERQIHNGALRLFREFSVGERRQPTQPSRTAASRGDDSMSSTEREAEDVLMASDEEEDELDSESE